MSDYKNALPVGYQLKEYRIESVLGSGGFGITYRALDTHLNNKRVAIKEYLPQDLAVRENHTTVVAKSGSDEANYQWGLQRFLSEAQTLAVFNHPNIVRILRYIEANNTAYLVMDYEEGESLGDYLKTAGSTVPEAELRGIFLPILDGLRAVHDAGLLHRDIKPDNIFLRSDASPMLIDFGSARQAIGEKSRSLSVVISAGYAPFEQYSSKGKQGAWTDIYSVGASLYRCMTGEAPPEATDRSAALNDEEPDPYVSVRQVAKDHYSDVWLSSVDAALSFRIKHRPQTVRAFQRVLLDLEESESTPVPDPKPKPKPKPKSTPRPKPTATPDPIAPRGRGFVRVLMGLGLLGAGMGLMHWYQAQQPVESMPVPVSVIEKPATYFETPAAIPIVREKKPQAGDIKQDALSDGSLAPKMVYIPAGEFRMGDIQGVGDDDEKPVHRTIPVFWMGQTEVTRGQFRAFVEASGYRTEAEKNVGEEGCYAYQGGSDFGWTAGSSWRNPGFEQSDAHPLVCVSWNDAQAYIRWLNGETGKNYRLPSESEWEYAARAKSETRYSFGNTETQLCEHGNVGDQAIKKRFSDWPWSVADCNDGFVFTARTGAFQANRFGLHDMHGNVWEWTQDCWNDSYDNAPSNNRANLSGNCTRRVLRGGSWDDKPWNLRSAYRNRSPATNRDDSMGFRLAQD